MGLINMRDLLSFPNNPDNATDTLIKGVHFNKTALDYWNYTLYRGNDTISNRSNCYIINDRYQPDYFYTNGSFVNATSCYVPIYGIKARGAIGIGFAALFAASIMLTLLNLKKHGQLFLREDKRFRVIGRRWQWYWMCFVAACGIISCLTGVDVDRAYVQDIAIVLQSFFYCLMLPGTLAMVWEAVRHWGSWQERQICDRDPFLLRQDDRRSKVEFWLPLVFYLFAWLNFFMTIPRSWTPLKMQRSIDQQQTEAEPAGTDGRFKAASILAVCAYLVICYSLRHSIHYYKPRHKGAWASLSGFCAHCPTKLFLLVVILGVRLAYAMAAAWEWHISIFKYDVNPAWPFALGYGTSLLLLAVLEAYGFAEPNEDRLLLRQRGRRERGLDAELGITYKPSWWSKLHGDAHLTPDQRLKALTTEVGGGRPTARNIAANLELRSMSGGGGGGGLRDGSRDRPGRDPFRDGRRRDPFGDEGAREDPFRDQSPTRTASVASAGGGGGGGGGGGERGRPGAARRASDNASTMTGASGATGLTGRTLMEGPMESARPVRIRSMLDV